MDRFSAESSRRLRELANDLDMIMPSNEAADSTQEDFTNQTPLDTVEEQRLGILDVRSAPPPPPPPPQERLPPPGRPTMRREGSVPPPPSTSIPLFPSSSAAPPPPPPANDVENTNNPTDSLSLMQLRRLVTEMPRVEPTPYAFSYTDAASLPEELEEWFAYSVEERARILKAQSSFAAEWGAHNGWVFTGDEEGGLDWMVQSGAKRKAFMAKLVKGLEEGGGKGGLDKRLRMLEALVYLILGVWHETAGIAVATHSRVSSWGSSDSGKYSGKGKQKAGNTGLQFTPPTSVSGSSPDASRRKAVEATYKKSGLQLEWMQRNILMLFEIKGLQPIFDVVRTACLREW